MARSAVLTAYVMLTVSQVMKCVELFCRCRGMGGRSCTDVAVSCLPPDAGSVHHALVSALASATSSQGHEAAANAWAVGTEEPESHCPCAIRCLSLSGRASCTRGSAALPGSGPWGSLSAHRGHAHRGASHPRAGLPRAP